jgi:hypothetical protein
MVEDAVERKEKKLMEKWKEANCTRDWGKEMAAALE